MCFNWYLSAPIFQKTKLMLIFGRGVYHLKIDLYGNHSTAKFRNDSWSTEIICLSPFNTLLTLILSRWNGIFFFGNTPCHGCYTGQTRVHLLFSGSCPVSSAQINFRFVDNHILNEIRHTTREYFNSVDVFVCTKYVPSKSNRLLPIWNFNQWMRRPAWIPNVGSASELTGINDQLVGVLLFVTPFM